MPRVYEVFADYHQICLRADPALDAPEVFTADDCRWRVLARSGVLTLMTERNKDVSVAVDTVAVPPPLDFATFDHVVEASLDLPGGCLAITDIVGGFCEIIDVLPMLYRVRFTGSGYASLNADKLEGDDRNAINLWPAPFADVVVLKQYEA